jgi:hypothetical protein
MLYVASLRSIKRAIVSNLIRSYDRRECIDNGQIHEIVLLRSLTIHLEYVVYGRYVVERARSIMGLHEHTCDGHPPLRAMAYVGLGRAGEP